MNQIVKSTTDALTIGETFFKSGMFSDIKSAQQAVVKIMAGAEMGISPFASMAGIHIIQGKPTIGAGLMAARVKGFGKYDYKVIEHNEKVCSIEYFQGKESIGVSTFTLEDAKKAGTKNLDKFPKNMLFARAMSNGVKWYTPDIYEAPVYVPEEMEHITEDVQVVEVSKKKVLTPDQFEKLCAGIEAKQLASGTELSLYDWAIENLDLTDAQRLQIETANKTQTFEL
jgi:vancomycin resistance protein YoaR